VSVPLQHQDLPVAGMGCCRWAAAAGGELEEEVSASSGLSIHAVGLGGGGEGSVREEDGKRLAGASN
jgi:hypothetical protein